MIDHLAAAADPRVIAVVLARDERTEEESDALRFLRTLRENGVTASRDSDQARDLLDALAAWDECMEKHKSTCDAREDTRAALDDALDAICGGES